MFRTFARAFLPNPFDWMLKRTAKKGGQKILIAWNRGLGDIALGLYAMVQRTREFIPNAEITFLTRENLRDGFSLLEGIEVLASPSWKRGETISVKETLRQMGVDPARFDLIIEKPSPTDWVRWQRGKVTPRLKWKNEFDSLWTKFGLSEPYIYIGVQVAAETSYGLWRNWPIERWQELFDRFEKRSGVRVLLFGYGGQPQFSQSCVIDLRGKTTLFELLSIIKNRCHSLILPDSGIQSMAYYLDASFPLRLVSLWGDPNHGILKQGVPSPNPQLTHIPLIAEKRDLSTVSVDCVMQSLFPRKPLQRCRNIEEIEPKKVEKAACILLAGGQGTRLGISGPKGIFPIGGKSLFEWICSKADPKNLPLAVMTSPSNHEETVAHFKKHDFFGLEIHFFQQEVRPLLDEQKRPIEIKPGELALGPNGNGSLFGSFVQSGLADLFAKRGIDVVTVLPVENPLGRPFDPRLIAFHRAEKVEIAIKCVERSEKDLSMGILMENGDGIEVVEYTEMGAEEMNRRDSHGDLIYRYANIGQLSFDLDFMKRMARIELPLHWVKKKVQIGGHFAWVWKGEHFIFDALAFAKRTKALCDHRELCYAPLKSKEQMEEVEKAVRR